LGAMSRWRRRRLPVLLALPSPSLAPLLHQRHQWHYQRRQSRSESCSLLNHLAVG